MSEDFTQKLPKNGHDNEILTAIKDLDTKVTTIDNRLENLEKKVDMRLHDTRPIWHKVVADIAELQSGQKRLEDGQQALRSSITELNSTARDISRDQIVINDVLRRLQLDFHTMDEKLYKLTINRERQNSTT
jgi:uncharacterized phage infection (PIP) family protein YhgE